MVEVFYEESALINNEKTENFKYNIFNFFSKFFYFLAVIWFFIVFYMLEIVSVLNIVLEAVLPLALIILFGILLGKRKNNYSVVYDYTFVTGSVRISKIIRSIKRKSVIKFECNDIEKIGKVNTDAYYSYCRQINNGLELIKATSNESPLFDKQFYYIVVNTGGSKNLIIIESSRELIRNIVKFTKRSSIDGELLK